MGFFDIGAGELLLILVLALMVVGPGKMAEIGTALGRTVREFQKATQEFTQQIGKEVEVNGTSPSSDNGVETVQPGNKVAQIGTMVGQTLGEFRKAGQEFTQGISKEIEENRVQQISEPSPQTEEDKEEAECIKRASEQRRKM